MAKGNFLSGDSNNPYVIARVRTRSVSLFKKEDLERMMDMSVPQILKTLQESAYRKEIEESAPLFKFSTADVIEHAVNLNLGRTFRSVYSYSRGRLKDGIQAYLMYWDIWNLKTLLRGMSGLSSKEEVHSDMVFGGSLGEPFWLGALDDKENLSDRFKATPFQHIMRHVYGKEDLSSVEDRLDRLYYDNLYEHTIGRSGTRSDRIFLEFVRKEIDLKNMCTAVKIMFLTAGKADDERVSSLCRRSYIKNGWSVTYPRFAELCSSKDMGQLLGASSGLWYEDMLRETVESESPRGVHCFAGKFETSIMRLASGYAISYPLSILPVLSFLLKKRSEVENIRIIARARSHGFSREEIRELTWM